MNVREVRKSEINPFISETGKDSRGKSNVIFSLEMGYRTICQIILNTL